MRFFYFDFSLRPTQDDYNDNTVIASSILPIARCLPYIAINSNGPGDFLDQTKTRATATACRHSPNPDQQ